MVGANGRDSPNKLLNKKIWHLIGQLLRLGPAIVVVTTWSNLIGLHSWLQQVQLAHRHDTIFFLLNSSCEAASPQDYVVNTYQSSANVVEQDLNLDHMVVSGEEAAWGQACGTTTHLACVIAMQARLVKS